MSACGPTASDPRVDHASDSTGFTLAASLNGGTPIPLAVEYAAAGVDVCRVAHNTGNLVLFGSFRDARVADGLDLATMTLVVDLADVPVEDGMVDFLVDADSVSLFLEATAYHPETFEETVRLVATEAPDGRFHLRFDSPPRPGIIVEGTFSLVIPDVQADGLSPSVLTLDGSFEVPVVLSCN